MLKQVVWIILGCIYSSASNAQSMDLDQVIQYALEHHLPLKSAMDDQALQLHELKITKQKFNPQLALNASATIHHELYFEEPFIEKKLHTYPSLRLESPWGTQIEVFTEQNIGYEHDHRKSGIAVRVVVEQPLLQGRSKVVNTSSIENAKVLTQIQALAFQQQAEQLIYQVIVSYHALVLCSQNLRMQERWYEQAQRFYHNLEEKVRAGRAAKMDLNGAKLQLNQSQNDIAQAQFEYAAQKRKLLEIIGWEEDEQALSIVHKTIEKPLPFYTQAEWVDRVASHDIETKILDLNQEKAKIALQVAKDKQKLDLKLRGDWTSGRYHIYGNALEEQLGDESAYPLPFIHDSGNYSAQILLHIPLTGKDQRDHQIFASRLAVKKVEWEQQAHQRQLTDYVITLLEKMVLKEQQVKLSLEAVKLAQLNYDSAVQKVEAGRGTMFEVILLREKLRDAKMNLNTLKITYQDIGLGLALSAGLLSEKWLRV